MVGVLAIVREALLDAWALVQPVECLGCGALDRSLCPACRDELVPERAVQVRCDADPGAPVWAAAQYAGAVRGAVLALKEDARTDALRPLAGCLLSAAAAALADAEPGVEIAPVPTTRSALRRRGHDPVRGIVATAGLPASRILRATSGAGPQKSLDRAGRLAAAGGRFLGARPARRPPVPARRRRRDDGGDDRRGAAAAIRDEGGLVVAAAAACAPDFERRARPRSQLDSEHGNDR